MRHFAITGTVTASMIPCIFTGSAIRATPPAERMSAGTRSRAITATAPASSAMRACSAFVTSMIHAALLHLREATLEELGTMAELTQVQIEGHESSPASYGT